jgi:DNA-binding NarL/FixJ family response regulator
MAIRVFLADDHAVVRDGVRLVLEANKDLCVVGTAGIRWCADGAGRPASGIAPGHLGNRNDEGIPRG